MGSCSMTFSVTRSLCYSPCKKPKPPKSNSKRSKAHESLAMAARILLKKQSNKPPNFVTEPKFAATTLVFSANLEQLLITKRSLNLTTHPGEYALPGGLSEPDETITQTALRELQEETGIESNMVSLIQPFFQSRTPYGMQVITCIARLKLGQVTLNWIRPKLIRHTGFRAISFCRQKTAALKSGLIKISKGPFIFGLTENTKSGE